MNDLKNSLESQEYVERDKGIDTKIDDMSMGSIDLESMNIFQKFKYWFYNLSKQKKAALIGSFLVSMGLIIFALIYFFKIDAYIYPSSINGYVYNEDQKPIENALVCIKENCVKTQRNGYYVIGKLKYGNVELIVRSDYYNTYNEFFYLKRGRMEKNIILTPLGYGKLFGKVLIEDEDYDKVEIYLDEYKIDLKEDGTFEIENVSFGEYEFIIKSPNYKDETFDIKIDKGENDMGEIELIPAADIVTQVVDWLSGELVPNVEINYNENTYKVEDDSGEKTISIKDIEIDEENKKVELTVSAEGYNQKKVELEIKKGINNIDKIEICKVGKVVYVSNRLGNKNVYISNYDGSQEIMLSDNKGDSYSPHIVGNYVYFISTREFISNNYGGVVGHVFYTELNGGKINKLSKTNYEDNYGNIGWYDFDVRKRCFVKNEYQDDTGSDIASVFFGDIDGTGTNKVIEMEGHVSNVIISKNGKFLVFSLYNNINKEKNGIYRLNIGSNNAERIYTSSDEELYYYPIDISLNNENILLRVFYYQKGKWDLIIVSSSGNYKKQITDTSIYEYNARFTPNSNMISYMSSRDGKTDAYMIDLSGKKEIKVTNNGKVSDYFYAKANNLVFYNSEKSMWVIDTSKNNISKKVTDNVLEYYYSLQYLCYDCFID